VEKQQSENLNDPSEWSVNKSAFFGWDFELQSKYPDILRYYTYGIHYSGESDLLPRATGMVDPPNFTSYFSSGSRNCKHGPGDLTITYRLIKADKTIIDTTQQIVDWVYKSDERTRSLWVIQYDYQNCIQDKARTKSVAIQFVDHTPPVITVCNGATETITLHNKENWRLCNTSTAWDKYDLDVSHTILYDVHEQYGGITQKLLTRGTLWEAQKKIDTKSTGIMYTIGIFACDNAGKFGKNGQKNCAIANKTIITSCGSNGVFNSVTKRCNCDAGYVNMPSYPGGNECILCPPGYSSLSNSDTCNLCIAGYGKNASTGHCNECASPKYNNVISNAPCATKNCPKGQGFTWHNSTHASCHTCPSGEFSDSDTTGQCQQHSPACNSSQYESQAPSAVADRVCLANVCSCDHGAAQTGADCTQHNGKQCKADGCNSGYRFHEGQCVASTKHTIISKVKIKRASSTFCNDTSRIRKVIAKILPIGTCGQAHSKCQPGQIKDRSCTFSPLSSTSARRMLSTSSTTGNVDYVYSVETDPANAAGVTSAVTNSTAMQAAVQEEYSDDNIQVEETTAHATTTDTASGNIMCDISSGFMPVARGASLGTCANRTKFFAGESCSPMCENGAFLAKIASCDQFGVYDRAVCTQKQCTCQNGVGAVGAICNSHNNADCASCDTGFHLDIDVDSAGVHLCKPNECSCANGKNVMGTACITHQSNHCASCSKGHYFNATSKACMACPSGTMQSASTNTNDASSSCQSCPKGTAQPSTASSSCQTCLDDQYTDQTGQTACKAQPTLSELSCNHAIGMFPTKLPSKTTRRTCISNPSCGDLDYHYTEPGMQCNKRCALSLYMQTSSCYLTRNKFQQKPPRGAGCSGSCRRRRTAILAPI